MTTKNYLGKLKEVYVFARDYMQANTNYPYHNWEHAKDVGHTVLMLAKKEGIDDEGRFLLLTSALMHDLHLKIGKKDNEELSAKIVESTLPEYGFLPNETYGVARLVRATDLSKKPIDLLERIMRDADVGNLGREDALKKGYLVMQELGVQEGKKRYEAQLAFMKMHQWHTQSAKEFWAEGKKINMQTLRQKIQDMGEK